ncbi:MAG: hypothetical protein ACREMQ_19165 [Longimicrobiales bacterium]
MPGYGVVGSGMGQHTYKRHEGKLHGLAEKIKKYKKTARTSFVTNTRVGKYLESIEAI